MKEATWIAVGIAKNMARTLPPRGGDSRNFWGTALGGSDVTVIYCPHCSTKREIGNLPLNKSSTCPQCGWTIVAETLEVGVPAKFELRAPNGKSIVVEGAVQRVGKSIVLTISGKDK